MSFFPLGKNRIGISPHKQVMFSLTLIPKKAKHFTDSFSNVINQLMLLPLVVKSLKI